MTIERFIEGELRAPSRTHRFTVVAQDPSVHVSDADPAILTSVVEIPSERYLPGPRGARFQVVDLDTASGKVGPQSLMDLTEPEADAVARAAAAGTFDAAARAQNVYVVAARTLALFEQALGRRIPWSFAGHQLYLVPAAMQEAQAFYDPGTNGILFGSFGGKPDGQGRAYTCLSYDIVAHETTHAVLDGMRHRFTEPGLPDQAAFHEALADIVALLSVFSMKEVPQRLLDRADAGAFLPPEMLSLDALQDGPLFGLAEELGAADEDHRGDALRRSVKMPPGSDWKTDPHFREPHQLGEVLVAAVAQTLLQMWHGRLIKLNQEGRPISVQLAAEEGAKAASHLLNMCIRAIDYTPPIEFLFEDFLDAIIAADKEVAPDDEHHYREILTAVFASYGIEDPPDAEHDVLTPAGHLEYSSLHLDELRNDPDEVFRFIWENAAALDIKTQYYLAVETVEPARRVGPDGFVVYEIAASYVQLLDGSVADLAKLAKSQGGELVIPTGLDPATRLQIQGGGALIFDEFGRAKFHQRKSIFGWKRQSERLAYLVEKGKKGKNNKAGKAAFGFSDGTSVGERFRLLHLPSDVAAEEW
jgi:hypothetical protein